MLRFTCALLTFLQLIVHSYATPASFDSTYTPMPLGISAQDASEAFPSRDLLNISNWYGTSLYGWDKCNELDSTWVDKIKEAYIDANSLVNQDGVKENIDFNSAAALEYLGPSALNVDQQSQIQAVLANVATVKDGGFGWTPNWIRARCDDPEFACPQPNDPCPPSSSQGDDDGHVTLAYARNPEKTTDGYPDINFCPGFFKLRNLGNAMAYGSGPRSPILRNHLSRYEGRADVFLHELMHLDLAANSVNGSPNPQIVDLKIKFKYGAGKNKGQITKWTKVYGPMLAKTLARFQPFGAGTKQTGYFIQRSDDSFTMFALAKYVQELYGHYPYLPIIYNQLTESPMIPKRSADIDNVYFTSDGSNAITLNNLVVADAGARVLSDDGNCTSILDQSDSEDMELGPPIDDPQYPQSYWDERAIWLKEFKNLAESGGPPICTFNISEIWTCEDVGKNLYASMSVASDNGTIIYTTPQSTSGPGVSINNDDAFSLQIAGMDDALQITGEHTNDYIQFSYGAESWTSNDTEGDNNCSLIGDDWGKGGPNCPGIASMREFTCVYQC